MLPGRSLSLLLIGLVMATAMGFLGWLLFVFARPDAPPEVLTEVPGVVVEYLVDGSGAQTVQQVAQEPQTRWTRWQDAGFIEGGLHDTVWMRITWTAADDLEGVLADDDWYTDFASLWALNESTQTWQASPTGMAVPAAAKVLPGREVAWPVTVLAGQTVVLFLQYESSGTFLIRPMWWPGERAFHAYRMRIGMAEGLYLGMLLALFVYTSLLWLRLRAKDFGYYVLYLGTVLVFILLARAQGLMLGWAVNWTALMAMLTIGTALSSVFLTCFARTFLEVEAHFPWLDRVLRLWSIALVGLAMFSVTTFWWPVMRWYGLANLAVGVTHVALLLVALAAWWRGVWQARFFVLSFGFLFAGSLPMVAVWFFETHLRDPGMRGLMLGSAMEMLLLSLALAERFVRTQRQLMAETEQRRMMEETYADELETEVRERTHELREANADKDRILAVIGHDLRSPLTGLMRSADATPGEFGREVAQTGRELLLLIEDLVQWARLRAGAWTVASHQVKAVMAPAVALHEAVAEHGGVELVLELPDDLRVETDLVLAQTLVRNLLANALKFAWRRVTLRVGREASGEVRLTVINDGPPLSPAVAKRLVQGSDGPLTATGGLGLRLCRDICEVLGTRLQAESDGEGTKFEFTLPASRSGKEDGS